MPVSLAAADRWTVAALMALTFATGLVDAVSLLVLGHLFVANMTGNMIFVGFWFVPNSGVDLIGTNVSFGGFLVGTVIGGRLARHFAQETRRWLFTALGIEMLVLVVMSILAGTGVLGYHDPSKLILIGGLAMAFGMQSVIARQCAVNEVLTTMVTGTIVAVGVNGWLGGGTSKGLMRRLSILLALFGGALLGATFSRITVAPVIALAAAAVAVSMLIFRFGRPAGWHSTTTGTVLRIELPTFAYGSWR